GFRFPPMAAFLRRVFPVFEKSEYAQETTPPPQSLQASALTKWLFAYSCRFWRKRWDCNRLSLSQVMSQPNQSQERRNIRKQAINPRGSPSITCFPPLFPADFRRNHDR